MIDRDVDTLAFFSAWQKIAQTEDGVEILFPLSGADLEAIIGRRMEIPPSNRAYLMQSPVTFLEQMQDRYPTQKQTL